MSAFDPYLEYYSDEDTVDNSDYTNADSTTYQPKAVDPKKVLRLYATRLTDYEKEEILKYEKIYFIGSLIKSQVAKSQFNNGFDDQKGAYLFENHDHIGYRYEIIKSLGNGAFGQVFKVFDHKRRTKVAIKVIRNKRAFHKQAKTEIEILKHLKLADKDGKFNFVSMLSHFTFRNHMVITFELLTINLFHYLRETNFIGCSQALVRRFTYSIVKSLCALHHLKIIHADLKPENIVLRTKGKCGIKLIDFGSSCFENQTCFRYLQSRFYRAPEVILQLNYGLPIDMWSLACIVSELTSGKVLFRGANYLDQLACILEVVGNLPNEMTENKVYKNEFLPSEYNVAESKSNEIYWSSTNNNNRRTTKRLPPGTKEKTDFLYKELKDCRELTDFVKSCLVLDPDKRLKPIDALEHPFLNLKRDKLNSVLNQINLLPNKSYLIKNTNYQNETSHWMKKLNTLSIRD